MKSKDVIKEKWSSSIVTIIAILMSIGSVQANYSIKTDLKEIQIEGKWITKDRNLSPKCPITVFTNRTVLYIYNTSPDRDITIHITNEKTGEIKYEETIPEEQTDCIIVPTVNLSTGKYKIDILGPPLGHLSGCFYLLPNI